MFVHSCWCMVLFWFECIGFEFKIHLNSNSLSIVCKRKRQKKKGIEKGNPTWQPNPLPPSLFSPRPSPPPQPAQTPCPARVAPAQLPPFLSCTQPRLPLPIRPSATARFLARRSSARGPRRASLAPSLTPWPHQSAPSPSSRTLRSRTGLHP